MSRRALPLALLALVAVHLLGAMPFAAVCFDPCPDDAGESSCPPVCATCTTCANARQAIVQAGYGGVAFAEAPHAFPPQVFALTAPLADDIFHVPLLG